VATARDIKTRSPKQTTLRAPLKRWFGTSHRAITPDETLARYERFGPALGITRLANITGLDYLGVPVFAAMRPNSRSLSVHQGKGLDEQSARASAFMEAAEYDHAERIAAPVLSFALGSAPRHVAIADPNRLARVRALRRDRQIGWLAGRDLMSEQATLVPRALVAIDFTQRPDPVFIESTNGLASGNTMAEAILSGLFETIERDATALWRLRSAGQRASRRIALETVVRGNAANLLARLVDAGMSIAAWDATTDIGIATIVCRVREAARNTRSAFGAYWGAGCHLSRDVALCRAVTEAVQTRLTYIAGARDDIARHDYAEAPRDALQNIAVDLWERRQANRSFRDVADGATRTIDDDVALTLARLKAVGIAQAIAVNLTRDALGIPVAKVVVPGLESDERHPGCIRGARALAVAQGRETP
jgi:YcaO-like protein with predicted kinase domain